MQDKNLLYITWMKIVAAIVFLIGSYCCRAQDFIKRVPTKFDYFITAPSVEWAAYVNDSIRFTQPNLSSILVKRMEKGAIRTTYPIWGGTIHANKTRYTNLEQHQRMFYFACELPVYDSLGNLPADYGQQKEPLSKIDSLSKNLLHIAQVLYVEHGVLKSHIPWVSPAFSLYAAKDICIGTPQYFSTCLHIRGTVNLAPANKLKYLIQTSKRIQLAAIDTFDMLKQLYGRNLLETIWPYVVKGSISIYSVESGKKIEPGKLDDFIVSNNPWNIYDSAGNIESVKYYNEYPIPHYVPEIEIVQDWYYDHTNNVVSNNIPFMILYVRKNAEGEHEALSPVLKIVF